MAALIVLFLVPGRGVVSLLAAYLVALAVVNVAVARPGWQTITAAWSRIPISRPQRVAGGIVLCLVLLAIAAQSMIAWSPQRRWELTREVVTDRMVLEVTPSIPTPEWPRL